MSGRAPAVGMGLPGPLPAGERVLWQGRPRWWSLARRAFHVRKLAIYCGALVVWRVVADVADGLPASDTATALLWLLPLALLATGLPALLAWLYARSTVYTITNRRVVMRYGVALPMTLNIPFRIIGSAAVKIHADGTAELPLALTGPDRIAYLHLWPLARPWRLARPEPMLRSVADGEHVATILAHALGSATNVRLAPEADATLRPSTPVAA